jgi:hypothetical protein
MAVLKSKHLDTPPAPHSPDSRATKKDEDDEEDDDDISISGMELAYPDPEDLQNI